MTRVLTLVLHLSRFVHAIAGASLVFAMLLTLLDVILRSPWLQMPIPGTYELVGFAGGIAIGLAMPLTSWGRGHVYVDTFLAWLPRRARAAINVGTRIAGAALFVVLAWNLCALGLDLRASGEVSPTLELRYYPVVFGLAAASVLQAVVLLCHIDMIRRGAYE
jgi:TRAP-type C4-dicarboxylate transport system permease small subunit